MYTNDELIEELGKHVMRVTFHKKDGSLRNMLCTRVAEYIPADKRPIGESQSYGNQIRVFDLATGEWRSFLHNNIVMVEVIDPKVANVSE